ncbi:MAG TPA: ATP-binding protein [Usitatibacter sp.]|nr:ATP-binding protein [Usitatibacter sp.]
MKLLPSSLRWRTLVVIVAALVLSQAAALYLLHEYVTHPRYAARVGHFVSHLKTIRAALAAMDAEQRARFIDDVARHEGIRITAVSGDEKMQPAEPAVPMRFFRQRILETFGPGAEVYVRRADAGSRRLAPFLWVRIPSGASDYWIAFPRERIERDPVTALLAWGAAGLAIAIAATFFLVYRLNRPLAELARAAAQIGKGGDPGPVSETGPSEIRAVARAFNEMQEDLQESQRDRATFLAGVSHDLRTPLSRLRLEVEMLEGRIDPGAQRGMVQDLEDMNAIIDQFIDYMRSEAAEPLEPVALAELARACAERAARGGASVACELADIPPMMLRPLAMRRLLDNLVANAARHAGGEIVVRTERRPGEAILAVLDRGPGIPAHAVARLKQPFTRRDDARSGTSGAGLGLAIADRVAALHGGTLELVPREGGGLEARVRLPLGA